MAPKYKQQDAKSLPNDLNTAHEVILTQSKFILELSVKYEELKKDLDEARAALLWQTLVATHSSQPKTMNQRHIGECPLACKCLTPTTCSLRRSTSIPLSLRFAAIVPAQAVRSSEKFSLSIAGIGLAISK